MQGYGAHTLPMNSIHFPASVETADGVPVHVRVVASIHENDGGTLDVWASLDSVEATESIRPKVLLFNPDPDGDIPPTIREGNCILHMLTARGIHQLEWLAEELHRHSVEQSKGGFAGTGCSDEHRHSPEPGGTL